MKKRGPTPTRKTGHIKASTAVRKNITEMGQCRFPNDWGFFIVHVWWELFSSTSLSMSHLKIPYLALLGSTGWLGKAVKRHASEERTFSLTRLGILRTDL